MKNLLVIRHAKSSWDDPAMSDIDRPLNKRGKRDAPFMGGVLRFQGLVPDLILCSPAKRAVKTARLVARAVGYRDEAIVVREEIYMHALPVMLELIRRLEDDHDRVYLVGHNPELTELVNALAGENIANIPTCGMASVEFDVESWAHVMDGSGRLVFFDYPKRHV